MFIFFVSKGKSEMFFVGLRQSSSFYVSGYVSILIGTIIFIYIYIYIYIYFFYKKKKKKKTKKRERKMRNDRIHSFEK